MAKSTKRGGGSIHLRKDGRWEGRFVVGYDERGYPKTKNCLARTKKECLEKLRALRASYEAPEKKERSIGPGMTFGEWMDFWYRNYCRPGLRPNTQGAYEAMIYKHILPALGQIPLGKLSQLDLQQFYTQLKTSGRLTRQELYGPSLSDRTVRSCHANCRAALDKAVEEGLIATNPADGCRLPPKKGREMQVLTREELQRLLIQAKAEGCYELFLLELSTGLRRGELLALQWEDLNEETGELRVERQVTRTGGQLVVSTPKTKASVRTLVLPPPVVEALVEYRTTIHSRWMFPSPKKEDSPRDPASCRKKLETILERAGCRHVRFHDLRHTFATEALEHGMDVKTLSAVIGHVSAATTLDIYTHVTDQMRTQAAEKIGRRMGGKSAAARRRKKQPPKAMTDFQAQPGTRRRPGTGCITQINDRLWEGRYSPKWPDGKKHPRNIYAHSLAECEERLAAMIREVQEEMAAAKAAMGA
ncbi:tyrosine-type recombinase/integrase [Dysosmobacter sp.]|uniref:tyrosine-type recombinase/integrase n=1 Tax=Dysosmobacter sp. TaxID=2591382 RepID=UPI003A910E19